MIDNFHYKAGPGKADGIIAAAAKKIKVSIIAAYGFTPMPLTSNTGYDTDALIDTARESGGATTAGAGKVFPQTTGRRKTTGTIISRQTAVLTRAPASCPTRRGFIRTNCTSSRKSTRSWIF